MGIPIDTSEPLSFNSDLLRLVDAVLLADAHDEHDWIEWKRRLDLTTTNAQEHIAKHVLGMANRTVATAAGHMGGYGYILIGVEPGTVTGVNTIDPTVLTDAILRYIGTDGPRWNAEYMVVGEHTVLVVVVWPPKHGDPVYTLRHRLAQHEPGRVLVRRIGQTKEASPAEHAALVERAKANQNTITVTARVLRETIEASPQDLSAHVESMLIEERELLMHPARSTRPSTTAESRSSADTTSRRFISTSRTFTPSPMVRSFTEPSYKEDTRTADQYAEEVEAYLEGLRDPLSTHVLSRRWNAPGGMVQLVIDNLTPRNFAQVRVRVHVSGRVRIWPQEMVERIEFLDELPDRPHRIGHRTRVAHPLDWISRTTVMPPVLSTRSFPTGPGPGFTARDGGSVDIEFDPIHLHPHTPTDLPPVALLVNEPPGTELTLTWTATSESADGLARGDLTLVVAESSPLAEVLPPDEHLEGR